MLFFLKNLSGNKSFSKTDIFNIFAAKMNSVSQIVSLPILTRICPCDHKMTFIIIHFPVSTFKLSYCKFLHFLFFFKRFLILRSQTNGAILSAKLQTSTSGSIKKI